MKLWAALAALCSFLAAQDFRSTISGKVLDTSGAAVPNAKVQAVNAATNDTLTATTDGTGTYSIPLLRPGNYKVTATANGFKQFSRDQVLLEASRNVGLDITLEVGAMTETVEVTAQAAMLDTTSASRGGVVTTQHVAELPLNARNPFMLGTMMAGVTFNGAAIWQRPFDNGAIAEWSINGSRNSSAEFVLDGASNDGQMGGPGTRLWPALQRGEADLVAVKSGASAFFPGKCNLKEQLDACAIDTVLIAGAVTWSWWPVSPTHVPQTRSPGIRRSRG